MKRSRLLSLNASAVIACAFALSASPLHAWFAQDAGTAEAASIERTDTAVRVAQEWFAAKMKADTAALIRLSALPFAWDRKEIIETEKEYEAFLTKAFNRKGARAVPVVTSSVTSDKSVILDNCFPVDRVIVTLSIEEEGIEICVRPGDEYKVVGFSD